jgi:DNA-binding response OmpR family regulator
MIAALEAGADEFLQKPFSRETVREKFEQLGVF